jgi:hypothetical protein
MKVVMNVEMIEKDTTIQSLKDKTGFTEKMIVDAYNDGMTEILRIIGKCDDSSCIKVETDIYDNHVFDVIESESRINDSDYFKISRAIETLNNMIQVDLSDNVNYEGVDEGYSHFCMLENKESCLYAINILRDFINEYIPDDVTKKSEDK